MKYIKIFEEFTANAVSCDNCEWSWEIEDGGNDVFICHKCGHDNEPVLGEKVNINKDMKHIKVLEEFVNENSSHLRSKKSAGLSKKETLKVAQKFADALSKVDKKEYTVNPDIAEDSFDLDVDGLEFDGGSYNINSDGTVVNMAVWNNSNESPVYGDKDDDVKTIMKKIKKLNF